MSSDRSKRGTGPAVALLLGVLLAPIGQAAASDLELSEAVHQAIASNLDLVARRHALTAAREEIGLSRSVLLPQVNIGARAQLLEDDRSDSARGNNKQESILFAAGLTQVLYDEESWAGLDIQKHIYDGQVRQLETFRLEVIEEAADAFLELDRAQRLLGIQQRNRKLTRENLDTSRSRIAAGWSSEREILRWEVQLAGNDTDVRAAQVLALQSRLELNRARNLPPESPATAVSATVEEYGFVYAREAIAQAILAPEADRRMRDFLVRVGLRRSPDLALLDASIAAGERELISSRRSFWVPTLNLAAGIDHLTTRGSADFKQTEWGVKGELTFPLFQGGAKFASLDQAQETLASLRTERRAADVSLSQSIRSAFGQASGSLESVGFASRQVAAAGRNFELVGASYTLGVASILDLLDAQSQQLAAELALANTLYGFLGDLVAAEHEISFYAFLEAPADVDAILNDLEQELSSQP